MGNRLQQMPPLKGALLVLMLACGSGSALLWTTNQFKNRHQHAFTVEVDRLESLKRENTAVRNTWQIFNSHLTRYRQLADLGFVGTEARLKWVEALRLAARDATAFAVDYQIDRQVEVTDLGRGQNRFSVRRSDMRVRLPLLHEGRLLSLLDTLVNSRNGLAELRGCTLTPGYTSSPTAGAANVQAECTFGWYTLEHRSDEGDAT